MIFKVMKNIVTVFFLFGINNLLIAQIQEKLLLKCNDSTILKQFLPNFDDQGNFLFRIETDSGDYVITANDTVGPMFGYATGGMSSHSHPDKEKGTYYISDNLPFYFGPTNGADWSYFRRPESKNQMHEAVAIQEFDHVNIYIDGQLIKQIDTLSNGQITVNGLFVNQLTNKKNNFDNDYWACLSNNGHTIYSLDENRIHNLYVDHKLVDTSLINFYKPMINDNGDFIYYKTYKVGDGDSAKYLKYVKTKDTLIGPIKERLWNYAMMNNGGYFYLDSEKWNTFLLINNHLYIDSVRGEIKRILIPDNNHFLCLKEKNKKYVVFSNDTIYNLDYDQVYLPSIDKKGDISLLVVEDYYLYLWKNGKKDKEPITKYGVRPKPISLDAHGNAIVMYEVNDSCFIYRNDELKFSAAKGEINYTDLKNMVSYFPSRDIYSTGQNLTYLIVKDSAYIIHNAEFSKAIPTIRKSSNLSSRDAQPGEIVTGGIVDDQYYFIWKETDRTFTMFVNGKIIGHLEGMDRVFGKSALLGNNLLFYGVKDFSLYQYTINL